MGMQGIGAASREVGRCVNAKVGRLQSAYLQGLAPARATMARLRKLDTPGGGSWMVVGEEVFSDLPDLGMGSSVEDKALLSIRASLKLYAIHQQSKDQPMAVFPEPGEEPLGRFGRACRLITFDPDRGDESGAPGVRRRLASIEATAGDFRGVETCVRALVRLMRAKSVQLDYGALARDLFLLQFESAREGVFLNWARDYYAPVKSATSEDGAASVRQ